MTRPDYFTIHFGKDVVPFDPSYPHRLVLLPIGVTVDDLGRIGHGFLGAFFVDADCAGIALSDPALDEYIRSNVPVLVNAERARDLRPFLRRREQFRRRGVVVEVLA